MKQFRKVVFWGHLGAGLVAGVVVLVMSVTGVLLTYEKQISAWADTRTYRITPPANLSRLPIENLVNQARQAKAALPPTAATLRSDVAAPIEINFGREGALFVDPYSGAVLGEGSRSVRGFFRVVTDAHRWLGTSGGNRAAGRAITGACNLAFLFLVMSGLYLWMPRLWTLKGVRQVIWFKRGLSGKARDFNWHNVIGFWSLVPLFVIVLSGVVISYTWAGNLVYRIVGEAPPQQQRPSAPGAGQNQSLFTNDLDKLLVRAEQHAPDWRSISWSLPTTPDAPVTFTIDRGSGGEPQKRAQLTLDRTSGEIIRYEPFSNLSAGRKLRSVLRFAHTGEVGGLVGQTIAGIASAAGAVLVWTGLALAWRRFRAWRDRRRSRKLAPHPIDQTKGATKLMNV